MRIALLTDLHGNLEALSACLEHARARQARQFVFLGDFVGYGADPGPVVDQVMAHVERGGVAVLGNHDLAVVRGPNEQMIPEAQKVILWTRRHLSDGQLEFLTRLPVTAQQDGRLYVHANAWAPAQWEYVTGVFDAGRSMRATPCRLTFCGHVHEPALYHMSAAGRVSEFAPVPGTGVPLGKRRRWLAIPGAVGQPRDGNPAACYALLDEASGVMTWFRVAYDHESAARKIRAAGLPESFAARLQTGQ